MSNQLDKCIITSALLLLLGSATAWAGPGDIDPNFGDAGRLKAGGLLLSLPDDRLIVAESAGGRLHLRRFDANGRIDPTFGSGGEVFLPLPPLCAGCSPDFYVGSATVAPDGSLLFEGPLLGADWFFPPAAEVVLRVDRDGHLVGQHRIWLGSWNDDGRVSHLNWVLMAVTLDSVGRILLAERNWENWGCEGPPSVVRLMPSGEPDTSFDTDGAVRVPVLDLSSCGDVALFGARDDGSIVIGTRGEIIGFDANGALDPAFGVGGRLSQGLPGAMSHGRLLPDGGFLIVGSGSSSTASNIVLTKFDRKGRLDPAFGGGTGSVQLDLGEAFFDVAGSRQSVSDFVLVPDARYLYLRVSILNADDTPLCAGGIARLSIDGTPDLSFGKQGLTCLDYGGSSFTLFAAQRNGAPLFGMGDGHFYRLLVDATASTGIVVLKSPWPSEVRESDGTVNISAVRTAGHDGELSASVVAAALPSCENGSCASDGADPGRDFQVASKGLDWADGEEGERTIAVTIVNDAKYEHRERFNIGISGAQGGVLAAGTSSFDITIHDDDPYTPPGDAGDSGGVGSLSWATLLACLGLLRVRRRFNVQGVQGVNE